MEIRIEAGELFENIQMEFCERFPYLKIDCVCNANLNTESPGNKIKLRNDCEIIINIDTTVADLVNQFNKMQGIKIKVLRKSNNLWIETSLTATWTIEKQNAASRHFHTS